MAAVIAATVVLPGCMEVEQTSSPAARQVGQTVKRDGKPWDSTPLAYESQKWGKGDRNSWEEQIKKRQLTQHEDRRIYQ
jgi:hypothetical protein